MPRVAPDKAAYTCLHSDRFCRFDARGKIIMKKTIKGFISIVFLSVIGTSGVLAQSRNQTDERDKVRVERQDEIRRSNETRREEIARQNVDLDNQRQASEVARRAGRMTSEEKQALRRQINEAGHDIYAPRR
jgi:hypothetical protein